MGRFRKFFSGLSTLTAPPPGDRGPVIAIPESTDILCEECHHHVSISGFIPHLSGEHDECPRCHCKDPAKLKYTAAWIRTEAEQRAHWEGRKIRTGKITAINGGFPKRLIREVPLDLSARPRS